jgi:hypothetical protein
MPHKRIPPPIISGEFARLRELAGLQPARRFAAGSASPPYLPTFRHPAESVRKKALLLPQES